MGFHKYFVVFLLASLLSACATNPVTGKSELSFVPATQEISIGEAQYQPSLQSQGGEYTIDPELSTYVDVVGQRIAAKSDRPDLPWEFTILNNSVPNAWALPGGKIAINRGLLVEIDSEAELAAVLGHEVVHAAARHGAQKMEQGMLMGAGIQILDVALGGHDQRDLIVGSSALGAQLIQSRYGRHQELEADAYGMEYMSAAGYDPSGAVDLQQTFVQLSQGGNSSSWQQLFASHPPSQERLSTNIDKAASLPSGDIGREYYQLKTKKLREVQLAYQNQQKGEQALQKGDAKQALKLAQQAIVQLPMESQFYQLKGASLQQLGRSSEAMTAYDQAIKLNGNYFQHYLARGLLHQQLQKKQLATEDLVASQHLLTTAVGSLALGQIAQQQGEQRVARQYFGQAAQSQGASGDLARKELLRMELQQAPHKYLMPSLVINSAGYLSVTVQNMASAPLTDISIAIGNGQQNQLLSYQGVLQPGQKSSVIASRFKAEDQSIADFRVSVTKAILQE